MRPKRASHIFRPLLTSRGEVASSLPSAQKIATEFITCKCDTDDSQHATWRAFICVRVVQDNFDGGGVAATGGGEVGGGVLALSNPTC